MLDNFTNVYYNISEIRHTKQTVCLYLVIRNNRGFDEGGYFFFVISITSAIMETIRVSNKNNSLYVIISTALLSKRAKVPSK